MVEGYMWVCVHACMHVSESFIQSCMVKNTFICVQDGGGIHVSVCACMHVSESFIQSCIVKNTFVCVQDGGGYMWVCVHACMHVSESFIQSCMVKNTFMCVQDGGGIHVSKCACMHVSESFIQSCMVKNTFVCVARWWRDTCECVCMHACMWARASFSHAGLKTPYICVQDGGWIHVSVCACMHACERELHSVIARLRAALYVFVSVESGNCTIPITLSWEWPQWGLAWRTGRPASSRSLTAWSAKPTPSWWSPTANTPHHPKTWR